MLAISIDWSAPDGGYSALMVPAVRAWLLTNLLAGRNLVQTAPGTTFAAAGPCTMSLTAKEYAAWPLRPRWDELHCQPRGAWVRASPCTHPGGAPVRLFVRVHGTTFAAGFASYLLRLLMGDITAADHAFLARTMREALGPATPLIIHNEEVDWFHMKAA